MEKSQDISENIIDDLRDYIQARKELLKLQFAEKISEILSNLTSVIIIFFFFLMVFVFVSITLAHVFAAWWGYEYAGYLTVTLLYSVISLLLVKFRKSWLVKPLRNSIIRMMLSNEKDG